MLGHQHETSKQNKKMNKEFEIIWHCKSGLRAMAQGGGGFVYEDSILWYICTV